MSMIYEKKLPSPVEVKEEYPLTFAAEQNKEVLDAQIAKVFRGESDKKLLIIGPCSADRADAVMDYCERLKRVQEKVSDKLILIPRIYTNKPRTTGDGYKGMLYQPDPNSKPDPFHGILAIRALHTKVLTELGMPTADEMLYPSNYAYLSDLLSYVAVGARSVENQEHRLVSSGIGVPVGMKNPTSGDFSVMMNAVVAANHEHTFIYREWAVSTKGNPLSHSILRGYVDRYGKSQPNYHYEDLSSLCELYASTDAANPAVIIDANHSNSGKQYKMQPMICKDVLHSCKQNPDIARLVKGFMVESYIEEGNQKIAADDVYGKSITDPCLGWADSEKLILELAEII